MQKAVTGRRGHRDPTAVIERRLENAWRDVCTLMTHAEFIRATLEAAQVICLRDRMENALLDSPEREAA